MSLFNKNKTMLIKESDEKTDLINLEDYYSNFFYKDQKFKRSFKNKLLTVREYFSNNPKIFFLAELTIGFLIFGFPLIYLFYFLRSIKFINKSENQYDQIVLRATIPIISVLSILTLCLAVIIVLKIKRIFKSRV